MYIVPDPHFHSFNTYNILRLPDRAVLGTVHLPRNHYCELRVYRAWQNGPERVTVNTLLLPYLGDIEAAFKRGGELK